MADHLQALSRAGVRHVHLEVEEGNHPALALYARLGFRRSGHRPGYYARPDGTRASALSMTLDLAEPSEVRRDVTGRK
jgi:ribosomal-protein-alanine N-acetyltransferase